MQSLSQNPLAKSPNHSPSEQLRKQVAVQPVSRFAMSQRASESAAYLQLIDFLRRFRAVAKARTRRKGMRGHRAQGAFRKPGRIPVYARAGTFRSSCTGGTFLALRPPLPTTVEQGGRGQTEPSEARQRSNETAVAAPMVPFERAAIVGMAKKAVGTTPPPWSWAASHALPFLFPSGFAPKSTPGKTRRRKNSDWRG